MLKIWWDEQDHPHRDDGPALLFDDGTKWWYHHGNRHRDDGPAIEYADGTNEWYHHGNRHRDDGPAIENADGSKKWYRHGELHREDGPAVEHANGSNEWWQSDRKLTDDEITVLKLEIQRQADAKREAEITEECKVFTRGLPYAILYKNPFRFTPKPPTS